MQIRITTKTFTLREIYLQLQDDEIDLAPDFQRDFVWKPKQQLKLIESILLGIPLPAFYFNQDKDGAFQVIDGVQRLTTIKLFMSNSLMLDSKYLEYLADVDGKIYDSLDNATRRRFAGTSIVSHVIEPQTPPAVKYDIFNRVNTGGSPLRPQEIRHCMAQETSRNFLKSLVENEHFDKATEFAFWRYDEENVKVRSNRRMTDREMALRFCAFRDFDATSYIEAGSLDRFLVNFTARLDGTTKDPLSTSELKKMASSFKKSMKNCHAVLGQTAFRSKNLETGRRGPLNRAIFEAQALALADFSEAEIESKKDALNAALMNLFSDSAFDASIRSGTGSIQNIETRLNKTKAAVRSVMQ